MLEVIEEGGGCWSTGGELRGGKGESGRDVWIWVCGGRLDTSADELDKLETEKREVEGGIGVENLGGRRVSMQIN